MKKILALLCSAAFVLSMSVMASAEDITSAGTATASSSTVGQDAGKAIDGDEETYWNSVKGEDGKFVSGDWISIEYDDSVLIESMTILWGGGTAKDYNDGGYIIETMKDGAWTVAGATVTRVDLDEGQENHAHYEDTVVFDSAIVANAIRITIFECDKDEAQIWEIYVDGSFDVPADDEEVEDVEGVNLALDGTIIVDSVDYQYDANEGENARADFNANDGDMGTRWQSAHKGNDGDPAWIGVELAKAYKLETLVIYWENARPAEGGFTVEISEDGETWEETAFTAERVPGSEGDVKEVETITLLDTPVSKYVRVYCFEAYNDPENGRKEYPSVFEFEVYGSAVAADGKPDDETEKPGDTESGDDEDGETEKPGDTESGDDEDGETEKPADDDGDKTEKPAAGGVADTLIWVTLFGAAAAAVVVTVKKVKA